MQRPARAAKPARTAGELAPHVLAGRERRGVQQLADLQLVVADHGHAGGDGDEERVDEEHQHGQQLRDRELGGDPRLVARRRRCRPSRSWRRRWTAARPSGPRSSSSTQSRGRRRTCGEVQAEDLASSRRAAHRADRPPSPRGAHEHEVGVLERRRRPARTRPAPRRRPRRRARGCGPRPGWPASPRRSPRRARQLGRRDRALEDPRRRCASRASRGVVSRDEPAVRGSRRSAGRAPPRPRRCGSRGARCGPRPARRAGGRSAGAPRGRGRRSARRR